VTYAVTVKNNGPNSTGAVVLTDTLPGGSTFVSAVPSQGTCSGTSVVKCSLGVLANAGMAAVQITITPPTVGAYTNAAAVSAINGDPNPTNNSSSLQVVVN
jgi:uncharacterized repeat protein (TIGR01451 family)